MPAMPTVTAEHERLAAFVGEWVGDEVMARSPGRDSGPARAEITARIELDGFYVIQDYRQERDGRTTFKGHGLFTFDRDDRLYKLFWFDSLGYVPQGPASGGWKGETLVLLRPSLRGAARHVYRFTAPDRFEQTIQFSPDNEGWSDVLTGTYRRR
jgi:Protein of unknown function (DUF1579)